MKIGIIGAGGVGGYYGARLIEAGNEVSFVARGEHAAALRASDLKVESQLGNADVKPAMVAEDPAQIGPVDLVIIAVKLWDTEQAARLALPMLGPSTTVVSLQNGIEKDDVLRSVAGKERVIGGVTFIAATIAKPGTIAHTGTMARIVIGELDGPRTKRIDEIVSVLQAAKINADASDTMRWMTWQKFVFLIAMSGTTTLIRQTIGPIRENPVTRRLLLDIMQEAVALAKASGIDVPDGFAEERLAFIDTLPAEMNSSMGVDLQRGNRLELEWLNGAVVRLGERFGVPTPVNRTVVAGLTLYAGG